MSFENIDRILSKASSRVETKTLEDARKQYGELVKAAAIYNKQGGIPGEFHASQYCRHKFKELFDVIEDGKSRYDRAHEEFQTLVYFYSCVNKDSINKTIRIQEASYNHGPIHGIDKLIDWAQQKKLPVANRAEKQLVNLREMQFLWDKFVKETPFLDKLPINDISIASTREIESLIAEARSAGLVADEKVAAEELQVLHRKANQYLTTIVGLPKEDKDVSSPAPRRRPIKADSENTQGKDKDPNRRGLKGAIKPKLKSQASLEKAEGEMISISVEKMRRMEQKEEVYKAKIEELTTRLSSFASKQLTDANPNIADLSDRNRPTKIAEKFSELYDEEWSDAHEELEKVKGYGEDRVNRELLDIVMMAFEFCRDMSETQIKDLETKMEKCMTLVTCVCNDQKYTVDREDVDPTYYASVNKFAREWRKSASLASVHSLCVIFKEHKLKNCGKFEWGCEDLKNLKEVDIYIDKCVELTWLMAVQQPKMHILVAGVGSKVDKTAYKFYHQKGDTVYMAVWPAVYLYEGGPLVSKGFVYPHATK